jgi:hypothetical protein
MTPNATLGARNHAPCTAVARPQGGLQLRLFSYDLSATAAPQPAAAQLPRPRLAELFDTFAQLQQDYRQGGGGRSSRDSKLQPFWLPIRWCEPGMRPEDVS